MEVNPSLLSRAVVRGMQEKKACNILVLDLCKVKNSIADFLVIGSGSSKKQLNAIVDAVDQYVFKLLHEAPWRIEGKESQEWMLLDYITVVVHVFQEEQRVLYQLESLWGDAKIIDIEREPYIMMP